MEEKHAGTICSIFIYRPFMNLGTKTLLTRTHTGMYGQKPTQLGSMRTGL